MSVIFDAVLGKLRKADAGGASGDIPLATPEADGLMSAADKAKLDGLGSADPAAGNDADTWLLLHLDGDLADASISSRSDITGVDVRYGAGDFGFGQSAFFSDKLTQAILIPCTNFPLGGNFALELRVRPVDVTRRGVIAFENDIRFCIDTSGGCYGLWVSSNGSSWDVLQCDSGYDDTLTSSAGRGLFPVIPGVWQHIRVVHSGTDWYLFVDGQVSLHKQRAGNVYNSGEALRLGRYGGDGISKWSGLIDEVKIDTAAGGTVAFVPPTAPYGDPDA